jgi:hypothetical protein
MDPLADLLVGLAIYFNQVIAKFHIANQVGDIVGSINIPPEQVDALLRQWTGRVDRSTSARMSVPTMKFTRPGRMSRQAILRGCL